jgi:hypothetical protein
MPTCIVVAMAALWLAAYGLVRATRTCLCTDPAAEDVALLRRAFGDGSQPQRSEVLWWYNGL